MFNVRRHSKCMSLLASTQMDACPALDKIAQLLCMHARKVRPLLGLMKGMGEGRGEERKNIAISTHKDRSDAG
jgi:hypothetical protein